MPSVEKELKNAILALPASRKDKLLLQLLAPNQLLQDQLRFELLEGPTGLEERRATLRKQIEASAQGFYYSAADLLTALRQVCPPLPYHVKVTGDAYGEVALLLLLLQEVLFHQQEFLQVLSGSNEALALFLAKRAQELLQKLQKLHEDLHVEFEDDLNALLPTLHASAAGYQARKLGVPLRWK